MNADITAIIPVFNGKAFIARAIRSVQQQSVPPASIIVVDDCSTDTTASIVEAIARADSRVTLLRNESNKGPSYGRNRALRSATTPVAAFLDADDEWLPDHLEHIARAFEAFPTASVAYVLAAYANTELEAPANDTRATVLGDPLLTFLEDNPIPQSGAAVRPPDVIRAGLYREDARYAEDYDLWIRLALANSMFVTIPKVTVLRTRHDGQVTNNHVDEMCKSAWKIRRAAIEQHYGSVANADPTAVEGLLRSEGCGIAAALHARRRDLVRLTMSQTSWIPAPAARLEPTRRLIGWHWPFWRAAAFVYDCLPAPTQRWWRARRSARNAAAL